ncbi:DNA uptake protein ComE-like DNA-binding protein [Dyadobacter jejuensis]|uniref:DNA uptake protein ComE-like DNA-binding protein n=1 Tax=Dyadobacter jejuensis TaxID=1082580 RepID=A0A316B9J3_9BACT|nr:helix-hairpin-helix domain-containing protein [Dyadobacter jejuensis]PWJ59197.1 DNA uptake protein ComE-like DNA-binding protein [Dyadobacter jejuensis]
MLRRIYHRLQDFFGITPKQARATLALIFLMIVLSGFPYIFNRYLLPYLPIADDPVDTRRLDSIAQILEADAKAAEKYPSQESRHASSASIKGPIQHSPFNPNTIGVPEMESQGIPLFLARRIANYRAKGGQFKKKEDLLRIYDFPSDLFHQLAPYIRIPESTAPLPTTFRESKDSSSSRFRSARSPADRPFVPKKTLAPFDINRADTTELKSLKGIGSKLALRIVKYRDLLGGFHSKSQYAEVYGLDSLVLLELDQYAQPNSPVHLLAINKLSAQELSTHPYLRNKKLAQVIVNYRLQHGNYTNADDLKKISIMDEATLARLSPYLSFE